MWLYDLILLAWISQKRQVIGWLQGDAFKGAAAAIQTMFAVHQLPAVKKNSKQHLRSNLAALFAMIIIFGILYCLIIIICRVFGMFKLEVAPPSFFYALTWAAWIQVGLWNVLLRYFFYRSTEDCFYERMENIENNGLIIVKTWPENYSILWETWRSILRTIRSYRWLLAHCVIQRLPYSGLLTVMASAFVMLTSAKRQPLPILLSLLLLPVTSFAQKMLQFSITVRCLLREIPLIYRLTDNHQSKVVKELWGSAYAFGYASILVIVMVFPMPCILWFHVAAANADLIAYKPLKISKITNNMRSVLGQN